MNTNLTNIRIIKQNIQWWQYTKHGVEVASINTLVTKWKI